jgi:TIR domain/AAA ATPase domain
MTDPTAYEYDIFLSHNRADSDWTVQLAQRLERETWKGRPLKVFYSERDIGPGQNVMLRMQDGLAQSRKVGLVLSPEAVNSKWVELEYLASLYEDVNERHEHLIPLMRRECKPPYLVAPLSDIDFRDDSKFEDSYRTLLKVIKGESLVEDSTLGPWTAAPIPHPPATGFIARYDDEGNDLLAVVGELLKENLAVSLIGRGGVGKTTLAAQIAREMQASGVRVAWVSAEGRAGFTLGALLDETAAQLGDDAARTLAPKQKAEAVRHLLAEARTRPGSAGCTLVVLDNFETIAEEEQKAIAAFLDTAPCAALLTTRARVDKTRPVHIGAMSPDEARLPRQAAPALAGPRQGEAVGPRRHRHSCRAQPDGDALDRGSAGGRAADEGRAGGTGARAWRCGHARLWSFLRAAERRRAGRAPRAPALYPLRQSRGAGRGRGLESEFLSK